MLKSFFGKRTKTFAYASALTAVGTCFFANSLSAAAINVQTKSEGFIKSKSFGYLKNRVNEKDIESVGKIWSWKNDNTLTFLEQGHIFFDATNGDKTRLEKWLALLKFAEKHCNDNDANKKKAFLLKCQTIEIIDAKAGELLAEYFNMRGIEELLEIGKLDLLYKNVISEDKEQKYKELLSFAEILNDRIAEYCSDLLAFCNFEDKNDEHVLSKKLSSARALTKCFCNVFYFRTGDKYAFMCFK